jgi:hypothetical protein
MLQQTSFEMMKKKNSLNSQMFDKWLVWKRFHGSGTK